MITAEKLIGNDLAVADNPTGSAPGILTRFARLYVQKQYTEAKEILDNFQKLALTEPTETILNYRFAELGVPFPASAFYEDNRYGEYADIMKRVYYHLADLKSKRGSLRGIELMFYIYFGFNVTTDEYHPENYLDTGIDFDESSTDKQVFETFDNFSRNSKAVIDFAITSTEDYPDSWTINLKDFILELLAWNLQGNVQVNKINYNGVEI